MVIEVNYKTKKAAANPNSYVKRVVFFEGDTMPNKEKIVKELTRMGKNFAAQTISIAEYTERDAGALRRSGHKVTKIRTLPL